jgi:DNA polymerase III subunit delta'
MSGAQAMPELAPWLAHQLSGLLSRRSHALLISGPSGLGQYELALALATAWLCHSPTERGACGQCSSCHSVLVRTHPDLCVLMPEVLSLALQWPLDERVQDELDSKKRKPSKDIKVEAAREAVAFTQMTRSGGDTKVVLVYPAERMNSITANTLLKTLEEPVGQVRFILASEAADQLLPTIRSRCQTHELAWPACDEALAWLQAQSRGLQGRAAEPQDLRVLLAAAGGRPADALARLREADAKQAAAQWRALPKAIARGDVTALNGWSPAQAIDALQKLCHDVWVLRVGGAPRYFQLQDLPAARTAVASNASLYALGAWSRDLASSARSAEHPFNVGLMLEALTSRARQALLTD